MQKLNPMKKTKNEKKNEVHDIRSPLQNLNGTSPHKINPKKSSNPSSSRTITHKKPSSFSKLPNKSTQRPEDLMPKKPFLLKSKKNKPQFLNREQFGTKCTKSTSKMVQRSKLQSVDENSVHRLKPKAKISPENGSIETPIEMLNSDNLNSAENCTPSGKIGSEFGLISENTSFADDCTPKMVTAVITTTVKTPPVEASVSPDLQCGSHSKMLVSKSKGTPVCYGAGHLLSGVTDKRKCRRRGSLRGGHEKTNLFSDEKDIIAITDSRDFSIPFLAEGSVNWHLSPCNEDQGSDSENISDQCKLELDHDSVILDLLSSPSTLSGNVTDLVCDSSSNWHLSPGNDSVTLDLLSSPLMLSGNVSDLVCDNSSCDRSVSLCNAVNEKTSGMSILSCGKEIDESLLVSSPDSIDYLSSGNIIQTPNSESGSEGCVGKSNVEFCEGNLLRFEIDSITETLDKVERSGQSEIPMWDCVSSSICTLENSSISHMKVSWRDELMSGISETDKFDSCRCLSDEEIELGKGKENDQVGECGVRTYPMVESGENEENDLVNGSDRISPVVLDYEPCISTRAKGKSGEHILDACAESICTSGGELVASGYLDWTKSKES